MTDNQTIFLKLVALFVLAVIAFGMLAYAAPHVRTYASDVAGLARRHRILIVLLASLLTLPFVMAFLLVPTK